MHPEAVFYVDLLSDPAVRARLTEPAGCNDIIDQMEEYIPHSELPAAYDWLVSHRNRLVGVRQ